VLVTGAGIVDSSERDDDATALVEFLLGEESQRFLADETFEYPLAADVSGPSDLPPLDSIRAPDVRLDDLGGGLERTQELIDESGLADA
jgi:iron(III) transport system substrate-binding protein